jgi:biopolymer transport protein ExbB/TolQ
VQNFNENASILIMIAAYSSLIRHGVSIYVAITAFGLFVAVPAVWAFNYFNGKVEGFNVEMDNSSSELLDYFIKRG